MKSEAHIDFQGTKPSLRVKEDISDHIAQLERRFGRVTACHVTIKAPSGHHLNGGLFEVGIRLALPGGHEVNVTRTATLDERRADLSYALNDAFKRARRRLQDRVRRMQGQ